MRAKLLVGVLVLASACAGQPATRTAAPVGEELADQITDLLTEALKSDARLEAADSLYEPGTIIAADGARRSGIPRYAGISAGGQVQVGSSQVEVGQGFAWAYLEYRWLSASANLAREGRLTAVLTRSAGDNWHIVHAHSSSAD